MKKTVSFKTRFFSFLIVGLLLVMSFCCCFTSVADPPPDNFSLKWTCETGINACIGPISKDIDGDGIHELFIVGRRNPYTTGRIISINGSNGNINWEVNFTCGYTDYHVPCAIADLNNDGTFEIVHTADDRTIALHCENGTEFWNVSTPSGWHQFVIADTDENGYPYVYVSDHNSAGGVKVSKLYGSNGTVKCQADMHYSCYGGVSCADLQGDGEYEIIVTDRNYGGGLGVRCYDEDLNLLWNYGDVGCSSHCSVIVDVDEDGVLDVVVMYQNYYNGGGICVIDGSTGEPMPGKNQANCGLSTHCQPAVYDIDNDGNLELITATHQEDTKVWDLVDWSLDATFSDQCSEPPDFANVMGDDGLEIISCSGYGDKIYNGDYELVYSLPTCSARSVVQDIDNDGLNELILQDIFGVIRAYDTFADSPTPQVRTDTPYYSERRTGAAEYIALIGNGETNTAPVVSDIPDQTIAEGESFTEITLDDYVEDIEDPDSAISWSYSGNSELTVDITNRIATITTPNENWNGEETITFTATDTGGLTDSDAATFTVNPFNDPPEITNVIMKASDPLDTEPGFGWENISCTVTDNTAVDEVKLVLIGDTTTEYPMTKDGDDYYCNITILTADEYTYYIWADDLSGNENTSAPQPFALPMNADVDEDGKVHFTDLIAVLMAYNDEGSNGWVREDVYNDGEVEFFDLVQVVVHYGEEWKPQ